MSESSHALPAFTEHRVERLLEFRRSEAPLLLIWGKHDPYLHVSVAEYMRLNARHGVLHVLDAGHWPQIDAAADVARILLPGH